MTTTDDLEVLVSDGSSALTPDSPQDGIPEGAAPTPDPPAACYSAAASTINGGSHAARTGYYSTPVDDPRVLVERVSALEETAGALLVALAILRDATEAQFPEHTKRLQAVVELAGDAGHGLRDVRRLLPGGAWDVTPHNDE